MPFEFILAAALSIVATAEPATAPAGDISQAKAEMTKMLDQRIQNLTEAKACVAGATNRADMKACHQNLKQDRLEMKEHAKERRAEHIDRRMQRMEERKKKLESPKD